MEPRTTKRQVAWDEMLRLEQHELGYRERVSGQRDKFMLDAQHGAATALSRRLEADGFIRADKGSLLFRDATDELRRQLEAVKPGIAEDSTKGFEVRWSAIEEPDIRRMFSAVSSVAGRVSLSDFLCGTGS